tara:strand:- start:202 stop:1386 length:1185 start_codon:yes stop_codon:yes gene_type:complete
MIKIAFLINYNPSSWLGGTNLIKNLIYCIKSFSNKKVEPVLIVSKSLPAKELKEFKNIKIIKTDLFSKSLIKRILLKLEIFFFGKSNKIDFFFKKNNINLISHSNVLAYNFLTGKNSDIKCLSWIADFQYLYYPNYFKFNTKFLRNLNIRFCAIHSSKILLSSYDAQNDLKKVSKNAYNKSEVSQFYFQSPKKNEIISLKNLKKKFNLKDKFFYMPNQYWSHKNHITVLKSLKYLKDKKKNFIVVSTGHSHDHRNNAYFNEIFNFVKKNKLEENYKYLGIVRYNEVLSLIFHAVSLINPSKFEGRHSSVEQARSLGKKIILSDINIHREQSPPRSNFFRPMDYKKLNKLMINNWENYDVGVEKKNIKKAIYYNKNNLKKYYLEWYKIVNRELSN